MTSYRPFIKDVSPAYFGVWLDRLFEGHEMAARKIGKSAYSVTGYVAAGGEDAECDGQVEATAVLV